MKRMTPLKKIGSCITLENLFKFFLVGLLLQFFLHTFVTFQLRWDREFMKIIWMWKELFVLAGGIFLMVHSYKTQSIAWLWRNKRIGIVQAILLISILIAFLISIVYHGQTLGEFLMAFKYDFFGFVIFFVGYHLAGFLSSEKRTQIIQRYIHLIKYVLVSGLLWWIMAVIYPAFYEFFGYSTQYFEGDVGKAPPILYKTAQRYGYIRNQFLFERPISYGFFLMAFWPLFYIHILQRKSLKNTRGWWFMYMINVIITFARSAWGAIFIQVILVGLITYKKHLKKFVIGVIIPLFLLLSGLVYIGRDQLIHRAASNGGHIEFFLKAVNKVGQKPLLGRGAATAGPGSHHLKDKKREFNPENQYLQILVEFGAVGFLGWMIIYTYFVLLGFHPTNTLLRAKKLTGKKNKQKYYTERLVVGASLGMIGLSIAGLVLHSFSDRMIVYPFMALYAIILYSHHHKQQTD